MKILFQIEVSCDENRTRRLLCIYLTTSSRVSHRCNVANRNSIRAPQRHPHITPSILNYPIEQG